MLAMHGRHWLRSQAEPAQHVLPGFGPVSLGVGFAGKRVNTHGLANADMPNRSNARANSRRNQAIGGFGAVMTVSIAINVGTARKQPKSAVLPQVHVKTFFRIDP
jgi:hypothetical protein